MSESERLIVVADTFNHRIQKLTFTGQCVHEYLGYLGYPEYRLLLQERPCECCACAALARWAVGTADGPVGTARCALRRHVCTFGSRGTGAAEFDEPHGIAGKSAAALRTPTTRTCAPVTAEWQSLLSVQPPP